MTPIGKGVLLIAVIGFASAVALAVLFLKTKEVPATAWVSGMGAVVAVTALANSVLVFVLADERARFANAFEMAGKWDAEPMLSARVTLRKNLGKLDKLKPLVIKDPEVNAMVVHLVNFYWNIASALEVNLTQDGYLKLRFRASLGAYLPLMRAWEEQTDDESAPEALASITRLHHRWAARPN
jgi:hypothetical protein